MHYTFSDSVNIAKTRFDYHLKEKTNVNQSINKAFSLFKTDKEFKELLISENRLHTQCLICIPELLGSRMHLESHINVTSKLMEGVVEDVLTLVYVGWFMETGRHPNSIPTPILNKIKDVQKNNAKLTNEFMLHGASFVFWEIDYINAIVYCMTPATPEVETVNEIVEEVIKIEAVKPTPVWMFNLATVITDRMQNRRIANTVLYTSVQQPIEEVNNEKVNEVQQVAAEEVQTELTSISVDEVAEREEHLYQAAKAQKKNIKVSKRAFKKLYDMMVAANEAVTTGVAGLKKLADFKVYNDLTPPVQYAA